MIPRSQHFGDPAPFPLSRSGIVRIFKQPVFKGLLEPARSRAHYAGKQANASVEKHQCGGLATGEDDVPHRHLFDGPRVENPLIEPLKTAA